MRNGLTPFRQAIINTFIIVVLTIGAMSITQLIKGTFDLENALIVATSQIIVGVPIFYFIAKRKEKETDNAENLDKE